MRFVYFWLDERLNYLLEELGHWAHQKNYRPWIVFLLTSLIIICASLGAFSVLDKLSE